MKWLSKKPLVVPDDPATEKQIDYIKRLVLDVGPGSRPILKRHKINPNLTRKDAFVALDRAGASICIDSLLGVVPATDRQRQSIAHNAGYTYEGLSPEERADMERAWAIASPRGNPEDPNSYGHLSKKQATEVLDILIGR